MSSSSTSCSSSISPTSSSRISSIVIKPEIEPYSSITTAKCRLSCLNSSRSESAFFDSGTTLASLNISVSWKSLTPLNNLGRISLASNIPTTSSLSEPKTGYLECPDSIIFVITSVVFSSICIVTISTLGIIISFTVISPNLIAFEAMDSASLSIIFWSTASFKKSVTSDTD